MAELTLSTVGRVMRKAGVGRASTDGKEGLRSLLESHAVEIASRAVVFAEHAGRKTVKAEDISLAIM